MATPSFHTILSILSAVLVCESLSATILMPFVGLFVAHLQNISPNDAGYMSGLLVSVFQLGQMLTGKMWGAAADRVGRKPMIQLGLIANALAAAFFGMSPNLPFCIAMRFLHGCANGNVLVAKTVIADITDKNTEGAGFAAISIFWGVGSIVGPAIGGFLYDPASHPTLSALVNTGFSASDELFTTHPAFLPCFGIALFSLLTLMMITAVLPETSKRRVDPFLTLFSWREDPVQGDVREVLVVEMEEGEEEEEEEEQGWKEDDANSNGRAGGGEAVVLSQLPYTVSSRKEPLHRSGRECEAAGGDDLCHCHHQQHQQTQGESESGVASGALSPLEVAREMRRRMQVGISTNAGAASTYKAKAPESSMLMNHDIDTTLDEDDEKKADVTMTSFGYSDAIKLPSTRYVLIMYMCIASTECALLEVIPLWAIADRSKGGLAFSSSLIGWMLGISSLVYVAATLFFPPLLRHCSTSRHIWDLSVLMWAVTSILTPCTVFLSSRYLFVAAATVTSLREIGLSWSYSLIYMYVARSGPAEFVGSVNGIAQSIASFSRMVTLLVVPPIFAWSLNGVERPFPFNYHFAFWLTCVPLLISYLYSSYLPTRVTDGI